MATQVLRNFSSPEFLKTVSQFALFRLLQPFGEFFAQHGLRLAESDSQFQPDYERLAAVFAATDHGLPFELAEALFLIDGMANTDGMDRLLEAIPDLNLPRDDYTAADVALLAWLRNTQIVERIFAEMQVRCRSRAFVSYQAPGRPLPDWQLTDELAAQLEWEIDQHFRFRGRGDGTRVIPSSRHGETWFLIRHGEPMRREGCIANGQSSSVFYRPERFDAVVLDEARGELRVSAGSRWQKELYRRTFGRRLFGSEEFFPSDDKYVLDPLVFDGRDALHCLDIPGIESVHWVRAEYTESSSKSLHSAKWNDDLFEAMDQGLWQLPVDARLTQVKFQIRLAGFRSARSVTIVPPNVAKYTLDCDGMLVEEWLEKRGFVSSTGESHHADVESLLACA